MNRQAVLNQIFMCFILVTLSTCILSNCLSFYDLTMRWSFLLVAFIVALVGLLRGNSRSFDGSQYGAPALPGSWWNNERRMYLSCS